MCYDDIGDFSVACITAGEAAAGGFYHSVCVCLDIVYFWVKDRSFAAQQLQLGVEDQRMLISCRGMCGVCWLA